MLSNWTNLKLFLFPALLQKCVQSMILSIYHQWYFSSTSFCAFLHKNKVLEPCFKSPICLISLPWQLLYCIDLYLDSFPIRICYALCNTGSGLFASDIHSHLEVTHNSLCSEVMENMQWPLWPSEKLLRRAHISLRSIHSLLKLMHNYFMQNVRR